MLQNTRALNVAVAESSGEIELFLAPSYNSGQSSLIRESLDYVRHGIASIRVPAVTMQEVLADVSHAALRLIKIDVEGAEYPLLSWLVDHAEALGSRVEIISEVTPRRAQLFGGSVADLLSRFEQAGYFPYAIPNGYDYRDYLSEESVPPRRLRLPPTKQTDIVLSRIEADEL
jgi:FkbM family methyltransferase